MCLRFPTNRIQARRLRIWDNVLPAIRLLNTILAGLLSKFTIGDNLAFYENYDEKSGETDGTHGVKMIYAFDSSVLFFNYYGGGTAYTIDVTRDNKEEERLEHIKDCLHGYFNIIGFHRIFINTIYLKNIK